MKKKTKDEAVFIPITAKVYGDPQYSRVDDIFTRAKRVALAEGGHDADNKKMAGDSLLAGEGLDVPGADLDDADEITGEEDEENNYYSLGGDSHDDLEEDQA